MKGEGIKIFSSRVYSFPFVANFKDLYNGIDKSVSDATSEMVLVESNVTSES